MLLHVLALSLLGSPIPRAAGPAAEGGIARIERDGDWVEFAASGALVGASRAGLETCAGQFLALAAQPLEWCGLSFTHQGVHHEWVGSGRRADWAGRRPFEDCEVRMDDEIARCSASAGPLRIETTLRFDPHGPYVIANVTLTNVGAEAIGDLLVSREWFDERSAGWTFPEGHYAIPTAPRGVCRAVWMLDPLAPGATSGATLSYAFPRAPAPLALDVPISLWTSPAFPSGLAFGNTYGLSVGDFDADGFGDVYAGWAAKLWRNVGGSDWALAADLVAAGTLALTFYRYGASFGDYDGDGWPDVGIEPRQGASDPCLHVLRNLGGAGFFDVPSDPMQLASPQCGDSETWCWADVDGDRRLDAFVPFYPPWISHNPGNAFYANLGPVGPSGAVVLAERSTTVGLDNVPGSPRSEGAFFADADDDGDLDLYCNGVLYANVSRPGRPQFRALQESASGIAMPTYIDEGAAFADHDMDGDQDLLVAYISGPGIAIWENRGDGSFFLVPAGVVQSANVGLGLGLSVCDWDNDGDLDFTTRQVFRRNQLIETGARGFTVATHGILASHISSATPSWFDWDKDGDVDCALGNWGGVGHFYENTLYGPATADVDRRSVRVRVLTPTADHPEGLETEYGARVRLCVDGERWIREQVVSSAGGYLNQNEYTLTFGLPAGPGDVTFDVAVDFPNSAPRGQWRVDSHVNPVLGQISFLALASREIVVLRDGKVRIAGQSYAPLAGVSPLLSTAAGGLLRPESVGTFPPPTAAATANTYVGVDFDTLLASGPRHLEELVVDGQVTSSGQCGAASVALWDVTVPGAPVMTRSQLAATSSRNHRSVLALDWALPPQRRFRLVAHVQSLRASPITAPLVVDGVSVHGGLAFDDPAPCSGAAVEGAAADPLQLWATLRLGH